MRQHLKPLALGLILLGAISIPAFATTDSQKIAHLEKQMAKLQNELSSLKSRKVASRTQATKTYDPPKPSSVVVAAESGEAKAVATAPNISGPDYLPKTGIDYFPFDVSVPGQSFVSTGPYLGVPLQFSGGNLIVNHPSVNQDVALLNLRKNINQRLMGLGLRPEDQNSHLILSGLVEGQANYKDIQNHERHSSDINLTGVGLDGYILTPSNWVSGLFSLRYDNNIGAETGSFDNFSRVQNSRVLITKAFVVIGDFLRSPFYGTLGQMYVPFGTYNTTMISSPLTKLMARTETRAVLVGYQQQTPCAWYAAAYAFKGDSHVGSSNGVNNGGVNFGYKFEQGKFTGNVGGGLIANIADSLGMQNNGFRVIPPPMPLVFTGFGGVSGSGSESLSHRVPAYDVRGIFSFSKSVDFIAEYIAPTTSFSKSDMTMNGHAASPRALNAEIAYTFQGLSKPLSLAGGYGFAKDALALGLPAQRYSAVLNTSIWRNTLQSLEFRHDVNYSSGVTATGSGIPVPSAKGKNDNILTGQFAIYF